MEGKRELHYILVDVFTNQQFGGNQLAVFTDGSIVPEELMLPIAKELNLSETTFVLPPKEPENDFHVRIFTPGGELPMAGHPTIGTAFVLASLNLPDTSKTSHVFRFEEGVGLIPVEVTLQDGKPDMITMQQPNPEFGVVIEDHAMLAKLLGLQADDIQSELPCQSVSCGVPYLIIPIKSLDAVERIRFRHDVWETIRQKYNPGFCYAFCTETVEPEHHLHGRMFAPDTGVLEDPATGSANGPLGAYVVKYGLIDQGESTIMQSEQGYEMGRLSQITITIEKSGADITRVLVGGTSVLVGEGKIFIAE